MSQIFKTLPKYISKSRIVSGVHTSCQVFILLKSKAKCFMNVEGHLSVLVTLNNPKTNNELLGAISLARVVVPSPKSSYKHSRNLLEATLLRKTRSVQRLPRSFGTNIQTHRQTSSYFIIRIIKIKTCKF